MTGALSPAPPRHGRHRVDRAQGDDEVAERHDRLERLDRHDVAQPWCRIAPSLDVPSAAELERVDLGGRGDTGIDERVGTHRHAGIDQHTGEVAGDADGHDRDARDAQVAEREHEQEREAERGDVGGDGPVEPPGDRRGGRARDE